jgi:hypothetical protein
MSDGVKHKQGEMVEDLLPTAKIYSIAAFNAAASRYSVKGRIRIPY